VDHKAVVALSDGESVSEELVEVDALLRDGSASKGGGVLRAIVGVNYVKDTY
jgi:hypothetical protein